MITIIHKTWIIIAAAFAVIMVITAPGWALVPSETVTKLTGDDESPQYRQGDQFGYSVAVYGDFAVVGAPYDDADCPGLLGPQTGTDCGTAHIYMRNGGIWERYMKVFAPDGDRYSGDLFGYSVAISGNYVVVGAPGDGTHRGAIYVYRLEYNMGSWGWQFLNKLTAPDADINDQFGYSVSVSAGTSGAPPLNFVLAGAPYQEDAANCGVLGIDCGSAYVYEFSCEETSCTWWDPSSPAILRAGDAASFDDFGEAVAVAGNYAIVGAPLDDDKGLSSGSAYVFNRISKGNWGRQKITPGDGSSMDHFGRAVALSGTTAIVGAPNAWNILDALLAGKAYVFAPDGSGTWKQQKKLTASDGKIGDHFGNAVSLSGNTAVIGARDYSALDGIFTGAAYVFAWDPRFGWRQHAELKAFDKEASDQFGFSVAVNGNTVVVGANYYEDNTCTVLGIPSTLCNYGAAYVYTLVAKDDDHDGVDDAIDNCKTIANYDQANADGDEFGDVCDPCTDTDGDGYGNPGYPANTCQVDKCPNIWDPQLDTDGDGVGDFCECIPFGINDATIYPGAPELCDGKDNNCNGSTDEGLTTRPTACGVGACMGNTGTETCLLGEWRNNTCNPFAGAAAETCDNTDNDCDGSVDEGIAAIATNCGVGECRRTGTAVCQGGKLIDSCVPGTPAPDDSICDGKDSNCNGLYDEDYLPAATTCGIGVCLAAGSTSCVLGEVVKICTTLPPAVEICDGLDNDCNGQIDEGQVCVTPTVCDVDKDGDIDQYDLSLISRARGQAALPGDLRDSDGNGLITPNDVKACIPACTRPNCAVQ